MAKRLISTLLPFIFLYSVAPAEENAKVNQKTEANQRTFIYWHPFSTPMIFLASSIINKEIIVPIYLTIEFSLDENYFALIINPSYVFINNINEFRLGSGVGIRHFMNGNADGVYLQLMPGAYYSNSSSKIKTLYHIDILSYIGYSSKFSNSNVLLRTSNSNVFIRNLFFDIGIGYGWGPLSNGYTLDSNLGFGFGF
ncbi:MAG: hypothetical protein LBH25_11230 [Fibromonadaceae bacterium]|jgi:hypothetical protein|nr:hypothetical protein [Fibromonadaceae bacterium]